MKELLIYGALVASVLAASAPIISSFRNTVSQAGQQINTSIGNEVNTILNTTSTSQ